MHIMAEMSQGGWFWAWHIVRVECTVLAGEQISTHLLRRGWDYIKRWEERKPRLPVGDRLSLCTPRRRHSLSYMVYSSNVGVSEAVWQEVAIE